MKFINIFKLYLCFGILILFANCNYKVNEEERPPNIILINIDDMGYADIGPFGSPINKTPHLDKMAEEGLKLTSFYSPDPVCSPSRAGLMTGTYPKRIGMARASEERIVFFPGDRIGLNPSEITIADLLKEAGYATGIFGKWHLGDQPEFLPNEQGFDEYYGIPYSNDMWHQHDYHPYPPLPILHNTQIVDTVLTMEDQGELAYQFTSRATEFIRKHKDGPFFVYLPHAFVHSPRMARPEFMSNAWTAEQAQVEEVDWSVGQILQTIREEGLADNTLVIFTSDNGGSPSGMNVTPLRGWKSLVWEGGFRVPTLAWWPGTIPAGSVTEEMASHLDLFPTFANLAGVELPADRIIDGKDISDLLLNPSDAISPHEYFFYYSEDTLRAVRSGPWKYVRSDRTLHRDTNLPGPWRWLQGDRELYNLEDDIGERFDRAPYHPDIVERLKKAMREHEQDILNNSRVPGKVDSSRTLLPRPGVEGEEAYRRTLSLDY